MNEETLYKIVEHIFNNWYGLKLAVEHSMGGPNSRQLAIDSVKEVTQYCIEDRNLDCESLEDYLDDLMDEKFDTIFEDGSTKEIATVLNNFVQLLRNNDLVKCEEEFSKLPVVNTNWLQSNQVTNRRDIPVDSSSSSDDDDGDNNDVQMEDDGWTVVASRKKR